MTRNCIKQRASEIRRLSPPQFQPHLTISVRHSKYCLINSVPQSTLLRRGNEDGRHHGDFRFRRNVGRSRSTEKAGVGRSATFVGTALHIWRTSNLERRL